MLLDVARDKLVSGELRRAVVAAEAAQLQCPGSSATATALRAEIAVELQRARVELAQRPVAESPADLRAVAALQRYSSAPRTARQRLALDRAIHAAEQALGEHVQVRARSLDGVDTWFWSADGRYLATFHERIDGLTAVTVFDGEGVAPVFAVRQPREANEVSFSQDSRFLISNFKPPVLLDLHTGRLTSFARDSWLTVSPDGSRLLVSGFHELELFGLPPLALLGRRSDIDGFSFPEFAPGGRVILGAGADSMVALDAATLAPWPLAPARSTLVVGNQSREAATIAPDSSDLVIHDLSSGVERRRWPGSTQAPPKLAHAKCIAWSSDGRWFAGASGSDPLNLSLLDVTTGRSTTWRGKLPAPLVAGGCGIDFTLDGGRLCMANDQWEAVVCPWSVGRDGTIHHDPATSGMLRLVTQDPLRAIDAPARHFGGHPFPDVALSPDGRLLAHMELHLADDGPGSLKVVAYDTKSWAPTCTQQWPLQGGGSTRPLTFSPHSDSLAVGLEDTLHVVDIARCRELGELGLGGASPATAHLLHAAYRPDGAVVASGTGRLDTRNGSRTTLLSSQPAPQRLILSPTSSARLLVVWAPGEAQVVTPDLSDSTAIAIPVAAAWGDIEFSCAADGSRVAIADRDGIRVLDGSARSEQRLAGRRGARGLALSRDGKMLAWAEGAVAGSELVHVVHLASPKAGPPASGVARLFPAPASAQRLTVRFSPTGNRIAVSGSHETLVADVATGTVLWRVPGGCSCAFAPDGASLAVDLRIHDASTGALVGELPRPAVAVPNPDWVGFSSDGQFVAALISGTVGTWRTDTGALLWNRVLDATNAPMSVTFAHDGNALLATVGGELFVIDPADGRERLRVTYTSERSALAVLPSRLYERLGEDTSTDRLCLLGATVLPFEVCEASLGNVRHSWRAAIHGDPSLMKL